MYPNQGQGYPAMPPGAGYGDHTARDYGAPVQDKDKKKKSSGFAGIAAAGVGGAALGALAGHALSDSSDDGERNPKRILLITTLTVV